MSPLYTVIVQGYSKTASIDADLDDMNINEMGELVNDLRLEIQGKERDDE